MITAENVGCGAYGVSCTKSIKVELHDTTIHFVRGIRPILTRLPTPGKKRANVVLKEIGLFYFLFADDDGRSCATAKLWGLENGDIRNATLTTCKLILSAMLTALSTMSFNLSCKYKILLRLCWLEMNPFQVALICDGSNSLRPM